MIRAKLENGVQIILNNGEWSCADPDLQEQLNDSQKYWRSRETDYYLGSITLDHNAAAKVLAQFGGEVTCITFDKYATTTTSPMEQMIG
jgi:hypothetical protein